ncbi:MAG: hypothetical protein KAG66_12165, partial [Methylococcales bacterium]|nr:hypothetical protein [Methylococcales bacterium]
MRREPYIKPHVDTIVVTKTAYARRFVGQGVLAKPVRPDETDVGGRDEDGLALPPTFGYQGIVPFLYNSEIETVSISHILYGFLKKESGTRDAEWLLPIIDETTVIGLLEPGTKTMFTTHIINDTAYNIRIVGNGTYVSRGNSEIVANSTQSFMTVYHEEMTARPGRVAEFRGFSNRMPVSLFGGSLTAQSVRVIMAGDDATSPTPPNFIINRGRTYYDEEILTLSIDSIRSGWIETTYKKDITVLFPDAATINTHMSLITGDTFYLYIRNNGPKYMTFKPSNGINIMSDNDELRTPPYTMANMMVFKNRDSTYDVYSLGEQGDLNRKFDNLIVTNHADIASATINILHVPIRLTVDYKSTFKSDITVGGSIDIGRHLNVDKNIRAGGTIVGLKGMQIKTHAQVDGTLSVVGPATFDDRIICDSLLARNNITAATMSVTNDFMGATATFANRLTVPASGFAKIHRAHIEDLTTGDISVDRDLSVANKTTTNSLIVGTIASVGSKLTISGQVLVEGSMDVVGIRSVNIVNAADISTHSITSETSINAATLTTSGNASVGGSLDVVGKTGMEQLSVTGPLTVSGFGPVEFLVDVVEMRNNLKVGGQITAPSIGSNELDKPIVVTSDISSLGGASFAKEGIFGESVTTTLVKTDDLIVDRNALMHGELRVTGDMFAQMIDVIDLDVADKTILRGHVRASSGIIVTGPFISDGDIPARFLVDLVDIHKDLYVGGELRVPRIEVTDIDAEHIITATITAQPIAGVITLKSNLVGIDAVFTGAGKFGGIISAPSVATDTLRVTVDATVGGQLSVIGNATFDETVTGDRMVAIGDITTPILEVTNELTATTSNITNRLNIPASGFADIYRAHIEDLTVGDASVKRDLVVANKTTTNTLVVDSIATIGSGLTIGG